MSTNYYKIPTDKEMNEHKLNLYTDISEMVLSPKNIEGNFCLPINGTWECQSPWDKFIEGMTIHLGKRSGGWKFCWNFHDNKYYSNKEELLNFIRTGRVVDEYGDEIDVEVFIKMALEWCEPNGHVLNEEYEKKMSDCRPGFMGWGEKYYDKLIDGLRVSSSTEFC